MTNITHTQPVYKKTMSGYTTGHANAASSCKIVHLGKHNTNTKYTLPTDDGTLHEISQTAEE